MDLIYADEQFSEIGIVTKYEKLDISVKLRGDLSDNSLQLIMDDLVWKQSPIAKGDYVYIPKSEWGGRADRIKHTTKQMTIEITGATWRGMLGRKVLEPQTGETHFTIPTMEANEAIAFVLSGLFGGFFEAEDTNTEVNVYGAYRYESVLYTLEDMLDRFNMRLSCIYDSDAQKVIVGAHKITDYADLIEISQDYGVEMTTTDGRIDNYNHVIALGSGELAAREVVHLYRKSDKTIVSEKPATWDEASEASITYDYPNAESTDDLVKGATTRLKTYGADQSLQLDTSAAGIELEIGDVVAARDRITGMQGNAKIVEKILTITEKGVEITTKAETD